MGILNKLGLKKKVEAAPAKPALEKTESKALKPETPVESSAPRQQARPNLGASQAYQVLLRPILSEKGTHLAASGKYVFAVHTKANKSEIRKSIQRVYNVHVEAVRIVKQPGKARRYGRSVGRTSAWKKAIVTVAKGEKIPGIIESVG
jgi:large subunit ribosomal protein L23